MAGAAAGGGRSGGGNHKGWGKSAKGLPSALKALSQGADVAPAIKSAVGALYSAVVHSVRPDAQSRSAPSFGQDSAGLEAGFPAVTLRDGRPAYVKNHNDQWATVKWFCPKCWCAHWSFRKSKCELCQAKRVKSELLSVWDPKVAETKAKELMTKRSSGSAPPKPKAAPKAAPKTAGTSSNAAAHAAVAGAAEYVGGTVLEEEVVSDHSVRLEVPGCLSKDYVKFLCRQGITAAFTY